MAVTIKQVAAKAGVATSTVSRVIADHPAISEKTKEKVRRVMDELHYIPNTSAQSLARSHAEAIGIILPEASDTFYQNPFFPTVLRGINDAITQHDDTMILSSGTTTDERLANIKKMILGHQVDGLIFLYAKTNDPLLDFARSQDFPLVVIGTPDDPTIPNIDNDNRRMTCVLTEHLIQAGSRQPLYIGGDRHQQFVMQRLEGFKDALSKNQLAYSSSQVHLDTPFDARAGYQLADTLADQQLSFDALVVSDQLIARGMRTYYLKAQLPLPPIATFKAYQSDHTLIGPNECYIDLDSQELGRKSVALLFDMTQNDNATTIDSLHRLIPATLITPTN